MVDSASERLFRLRVGSRIFENLSVTVVVKNIRNGKLKPDHMIAHSGSDKWTRLGDVPQLAAIFEKAADTRQEDEFQPAPKPKRYDVLRGDEITGPLPLSKVAELIRDGELIETDKVRLRGEGDWSLAGDVDALRRHFDQLRREVLIGGFSAVGKTEKGPPFYIDLGAPFVYIGRLTFLLNLIAILIFYAIANLVQIPIVAGPLLIMTNLYLYAYYFRVVSNSSVGGKKFPEFTDISDFTGGLLRPAFQFFSTQVVSTLPLMLYIVMYKLGPFEFFIKVPYVFFILSNPWSMLLIPIPSGAETYQTSIPKLDGSGGEIVIAEMTLPTGFEMLFSDPFVFGPYLALIAFMLLIDLFFASVMFALVLLLGMSMMGPAGSGAAMVLQLPFVLTLQALTICGTFLKMFFIGRFVYQYSDRMGWH